jgi:pSer/pThr/pTyr-binding forkhead associated (FHA) protein
MALEPVSVALKFGFLAVLYLFLLWVARSALKDLRRQEGGHALVPAPAPDATSLHAAVGGDGRRDALLVVERAPGHENGVRYDVSSGATLGRGDVEIVLEDPFASSQHARIERHGNAVVLEDLGSTNGTYLNEELLRGPQPLHAGDRIRIGDSHFVFHG